MSTETAQLILVAVTTVGAVVWLIGLWFLVATASTKKVEPPVDHFAFAEQLPANWFLGSVEVEGLPNVLVDRLASILVRRNPMFLKIVEKSNARLSFEWLGSAKAAHPRHGQIKFTAQSGGRTRIEYALEAAEHRWLLAIGALFQLLGLIALVAGAWLIEEFCVSSADPQIRNQSVQIVQTAHFLWPPFLFGGLYRQRKRAATVGFEVLLNNLPFHRDAPVGVG